jgi:uncharacterized protein involved in exopolysaccharide biosynthesis
MKQKDKEELLNEDDGVSVSTLFSKTYSHIKYLKTRWYIILIVATIGLILGIWFSMSRKPQYVAFISFTVEDPSQAQSGIAGLASELGVSFGSSKQGIFEGFNIVSFFQSRLMVQKTLLTKVHFQNGDDLLINRYIEYNHLRKQWAKDPKLKYMTFKPNDSLTRQQDSLLYFFYQDILYNHLDVDRADRRLTILTLKVQTPDEMFSKLFAETLASNVIAFYTQNRIKKTVESIRILQHQTDSVRARLNMSLTRVASSIDAVPDANPLKRVLGVSQQSQTTQAEIDRSALLELASNLQSAKISLNQETPLIDFIDTPILPLQVVKLSKLKAGVIGWLLGAILTTFVLSVRRKDY